MKTHTMLTRIALCMFAVWMIAVVGCAPQDLPTQAETRTVERLSVLTPHNQSIRQAFELGFADWCKKNRDSDIQIEWLVMSTPQCIEYIDSVVAGVNDGRKRRLPDIMFGGGVADHELLAQRGYSRQLKMNDAVGDMPAEVYGLPTRDADGQWYATGLSSFGIAINKSACQQRGIEPPGAWSDLADARFRGWLGIASPAYSGSHRQAMVFILQSQGWTDGWSTIIRSLANARALAGGSEESLDLVERGIFLASYSVNFDGLRRAEESGGVLGYINPPGATAATPDIVSALKSPSDPKLSEDFVRYCLSEAGQVTWGVQAEHAEQLSTTLYHYPIDQKIYEKFADHLAVKEDPFKVDLGLKINGETAAKQGKILGLLVGAACGENHIVLQKAWDAVIASGMNADALAALCAPPLEESAAYEAVEKLHTANAEEVAKMQAEWADMFKKRYESVIAMCEG